MPWRQRLHLSHPICQLLHTVPRIAPELRSGGKPVLLRDQDRAERVVVSDKSILQDFDRPEGLADLETDR